MGQDGAPQHGPDALDGVEIGRVGRRWEDREPVTVSDLLTHSCGEVAVEMVPDQQDRAAELVAGGLDQVGVVPPDTRTSRIRAE